MAPHWKDVARLIGMDTEIIQKDNPNDSLKCIEAVMRKWIQDAPNITSYPCTWKGLCELLDDIELGEASKKLREAYECNFEK